MKFAEHLSAHITPEWRKQYINYEKMKNLLYSTVERAPSAEEVESEVLSRYVAKFDEQFFHYCDKELTKINTFFAEKLAEASRKYANLKAELAELMEDTNAEKKNKFLGSRSATTRKLQELKLAFSEFYLSLILLQNYQNLNFTGFRKILKKHDKLLNVDNGAQYRIDNVEMSHFYTNKDIDKLIREVESTFTHELERGDRQKAMKRLRVPPLGEKQSPWVTFKVGLFSGSFIVLLISVVISSIVRKDYDWKIAIRLYRGPLLLVEFLFFMGVNVYGWRSSGVNHVLIFELDPRNHLSEQDIMEVAAIFGVVWNISVLAFFYSRELSIPPYVNPLALVVVMIAFMFNPTKTFHREARFWALKVLLRIILAPFFYVHFADFWFADQLTSLAPVFLDFQYFVCFYVSSTKWANPNWIATENDNNICSNKYMAVRPILTALPAWFRFAQCCRRFRDTREKLPHMANAAKYSTTFFVILFSTLYSSTQAPTLQNTFFWLWILALLISSSYSYAWDVKLDWGLFDKRAGENKLLREEIIYPNWTYYFAIFEDFILRFTWALSISLTEAGVMHSDVIVSIFAPLEVFRRFIWNYFRLENEHLNNCGKFRAVRDISVAPLDTSDQIQIIKMMDEAEGVSNRRRKALSKRKDKVYHEAGSDEELVFP
ncbi:hypothetical protein RUM43_014111 [Polyplax serrata]|uniref:Xenotropic and polytropic retrovirus receptor 1 n=1 Tax=Polyplax serrata TaxID=468196 RepID=A0AAN8RSB0_POLSC